MLSIDSNSSLYNVSKASFQKVVQQYEEILVHVGYVHRMPEVMLLRNYGL